MPAQCLVGDVTFQHLLGRPLKIGRNGPPTNGCDRPEIRSCWGLGLRSAVPPHHAPDASDITERAAGVRRFLVPVATRFRPMPLARREDDVDDRVEPECAVVASVSLVIEPVFEMLPDEATSPPSSCAKPIVIKIPVHEARGRLAPIREYRELPWPSESELLAKVPRPLMPTGIADFARLTRTLGECYSACAAPSILAQVCPMIMWALHARVFSTRCSSGTATAMCAAWAWRVFPCGATLDCLYSRQMDGDI